MPSNLNALIRYKQIDKCLRNKYVDCTIARMIDMCSIQLGEYRGVYKQVSERTIRDDIKTMRGDSLGFNAPITVSNGVYSYSDEHFSIFNSSIDDMDLLKKVLLMLLEEKSNISNPKLDSILYALSIKTGVTLPVEDIDKRARILNYSKNMNRNVSYSLRDEADDKLFGESTSISLEDSAEFDSSHLYSWEDILDII